MGIIAFQNIFPKTFEVLSEENLHTLPHEFEFVLKTELGVTPTEISDSRWFPAFLKMRGVKNQILEIAEFEYLKTLVNHTESPFLEKQEFIRLNPSVQFIHLTAHQPKLGKDEGLYCFYRAGIGFFEIRLSLAQALLIDLLHGERKYNKAQLSEMAMISMPMHFENTETWLFEIQNMFKSGLLVEELTLN